MQNLISRFINSILSVILLTETFCRPLWKFERWRSVFYFLMRTSRVFSNRDGKTLAVNRLSPERYKSRLHSATSAAQKLRLDHACHKLNECHPRPLLPVFHGRVDRLIQSYLPACRRAVWADQWDSSRDRCFVTWSQVVPVIFREGLAITHKTCFVQESRGWAFSMSSDCHCWRRWLWWWYLSCALIHMLVNCFKEI